MDTGGSFPYFASVDELVLASDVVVVGTVATVNCEDAAGGMRDRRAVVDVEQTLYGDETTQLEIISPGDEQGGPITVDGVLPRCPGSRPSGSFDRRRPWPEPTTTIACLM